MKSYSSMVWSACFNVCMLASMYACLLQYRHTSSWEHTGKQSLLACFHKIKRRRAKRARAMRQAGAMLARMRDAYHVHPSRSRSVGADAHGPMRMGSIRRMLRPNPITHSYSGHGTHVRCLDYKMIRSEPSPFPLHFLLPAPLRHAHYTRVATR